MNGMDRGGCVGGQKNTATWIDGKEREMAGGQVDGWVGEWMNG